MRQRTKVVPIIVSTNDGKWLGPCLSSLLAGSHAPHRVIVVDNNCDDETIAIAASAEPLVRTISTKRRSGFAECNNLGFEEARRLGADYIYMLNPDTILHHTSLEILVEFLDSNQSYGIAGSLQYDYDADGWEKLNAWSKDTLSEAAGLGSYPRQLGRFTLVDHYYVQGSTLLFRAALLDSIGLLEPVYKTFYEETDFCRRCSIYGLSIALVMDSRVKHVGGGNWRKTRQSHLARDRLFLRNQLIYFLSAPQPQRNLLVTGLSLIARQAAMLRSRSENLRLPLTHYPEVVFSAMMKLGHIQRLRRRNEAILATRRRGCAERRLVQQ